MKTERIDAVMMDGHWDGGYLCRLLDGVFVDGVMPRVCMYVTISMYTVASKYPFLPSF